MILRFIDYRYILVPPIGDLEMKRDPLGLRIALGIECLLAGIHRTSGRVTYSNIGYCRYCMVLLPTELQKSQSKKG